MQKQMGQLMRQCQAIPPLTTASTFIYIFTNMHDSLVREGHSVTSTPKPLGHLGFLANVEKKSRNNPWQDKFYHFYNRKIGLLDRELLPNPIRVLPDVPPT